MRATATSAPQSRADTWGGSAPEGDAIPPILTDAPGREQEGLVRTVQIHYGRGVVAINYGSCT